jgi:hypothetical protein
MRIECVRRADAERLSAIDVDRNITDFPIIDRPALDPNAALDKEQRYRHIESDR